MYAQIASTGTTYTEISALPYYQGADQDMANHKLNLVWCYPKT